MTDFSDYNLRFLIASNTLQLLEEKSKRLFPSLEPEKALQITFISILQSIQMDFHPHDLLFPAISRSSNNDFQAILFELNKPTADLLAKLLVAKSLTSYANFRTEIRKRIWNTYKLLPSASLNEVTTQHNPSTIL